MADDNFIQLGGLDDTLDTGIDKELFSSSMQKEAEGAYGSNDDDTESYYEGAIVNRDYNDVIEDEDGIIAGNKVEEEIEIKKHLPKKKPVPYMYSDKVDPNVITDVSGLLVDKEHSAYGDIVDSVPEGAKDVSYKKEENNITIPEPEINEDFFNQINSSVKESTQQSKPEGKIATSDWMLDRTHQNLQAYTGALWSAADLTKSLLSGSGNFFYNIADTIHDVGKELISLSSMFFGGTPMSSTSFTEIADKKQQQQGDEFNIHDYKPKAFNRLDAQNAGIAKQVMFAIGEMGTSLYFTSKGFGKVGGKLGLSGKLPTKGMTGYGARVGYATQVGAVAAFIGTDPHQDTLFNLAKLAGFENQFIDYMASKSSTDNEGRFKQAINDSLASVLIGVPLEAAFSSVKQFKGMIDYVYSAYKLAKNKDELLKSIDATPLAKSDDYFVKPAPPITPANADDYVPLNETITKLPTPESIEGVTEELTKKGTSAADDALDYFPKDVMGNALKVFDGGQPSSKSVFHTASNNERDYTILYPSSSANRTASENGLTYVKGGQPNVKFPDKGDYNFFRLQGQEATAEEVAEAIVLKSISKEGLKETPEVVKHIDSVLSKEATEVGTKEVIEDTAEVTTKGTTQQVSDDITEATTVVAEKGIARKHRTVIVKETPAESVTYKVRKAPKKPGEVEDTTFTTTKTTGRTDDGTKFTVSEVTSKMKVEEDLGKEIIDVLSGKKELPKAYINDMLNRTNVAAITDSDDAIKLLSVIDRDFIERGGLKDQSFVPKDLKQSPFEVETAVKRKRLSMEEITKRNQKFVDNNPDVVAMLGLTKLEDVKRHPVLSKFNALTFPEQLSLIKDLTIKSKNDIVEAFKRHAETPTDLNLLLFNKSLTIHRNLNRSFKGLSTESGRAQVYLQRTSAANIKSLGDDEIETILNDLGGKQLLLKKASAIRETIEHLERVGDSMPLTKLNKVVEDTFWAKTHDDIVGYMYRAMLSGGTTLINAIKGNSARLFTETVMGVPASASALVRGDVAAAQMHIAKSRKLITGFWERLGDHVKHPFRKDKEVPFKWFDPDAQRVDSGTSHLTEHALKSDNPYIRGAGYLGTLHNKFMDTLGAKQLMRIDDVFKKPFYDANLHELAFKQASEAGFKGKSLIEEVQRLIRNPDDALHHSALERARESVAASAETAKLTRGIHNWANKYKHGTGLTGAAQMLLPFSVNVVAPFMRTTENIVKFGFKYNPATVSAELGYRLATYRSGGMSGIEADKFIGRLSASAAYATTTYSLVDNDLLVGSYVPKHLQAQGAKPYTIKIFGKWRRYGDLEPFASIAGASADAINAYRVAMHYEGYDETVTMGSTFFAGIHAVFYNTIGSKGWTRNLSGAMEAIALGVEGGQDVGTTSGSALGSTLGSITSAFVPNYVQTINNTVFDTEGFRSASGIGQFSDLYAPILKKIPEMSKKLPQVYDSYGDLIKRSSVKDDPAGLFFGGYDVIDDPVKIEAGKQGVVLSKVPRVIGLKGKRYRLDRDQLTYYQKAVGEVTLKPGGKRFKEALAELYESKAYKRQENSNLQTNEQYGKAAMIKRLHSKYMQVAELKTIYRYKDIASNLNDRINRYQNDFLGGLNHVPVDLPKLLEKMKPLFGEL